MRWRPRPHVLRQLRPAQLFIVPFLLLTGQEGHIVRPVIPVDGRGQPRQQVLNALEHIPWVTA
jgi:hypothetical protein